MLKSHNFIQPQLPYLSKILHRGESLLPVAVGEVLDVLLPHEGNSLLIHHLVREQRLHGLTIAFRTCSCFLSPSFLSLASWLTRTRFGSARPLE